MSAVVSCCFVPKTGAKLWKIKLMRNGIPMQNMHFGSVSSFSNYDTANWGSSSVRSFVMSQIKSYSGYMVTGAPNSDLRHWLDILDVHPNWWMLHHMYDLAYGQEANSTLLEYKDLVSDTVVTAPCTSAVLPRADKGYSAYAWIRDRVSLPSIIR